MSCRVLLPLGLAVGLACSATAYSQPALENEPVLAREPQTPEEMFQAAVTMLQLARPELAHQYLAALLASEPSDEMLFALRDKHGTALFVQMARMEALQPESATLLERLTTAARNQLADPAFQESLIQDLSGTLRQREAAIATLRALEDGAAPLLISRIAAGVAPEQEVALMQALLALGPSAVEPLTASLWAPNDHVRSVAADLLGRMEAKSAELAIATIAFDSQELPALRETARRALARIQFGDPDRAPQVSELRLGERLQNEALVRLDPRRNVGTGDDGLVPLWTWDAAAVAPRLTRVSTDVAAIQQGEQWARAALKHSPADPLAQELMLAFLLWRDVQTAGWDQPPPAGPGSAYELALTLDPAVVEGVLRLALARENAAAAMSASAVLAQTGSRRLLSGDSPLLAALDAREFRVKFAAAEAVLQLDPEEPFPGAGRVVEILTRALSGIGQPKSVVIDPNIERAAAMAGLMSNLGFESGLAPTGQRGFEIAASQGNVELAVLHLNTVQWELSQTIANLRADPRTSRIPIAVYGPSELRGAAARKLKSYRLVSYLDDAGDPALIREQLTPLFAERLVPELTDQQRSAMAIRAAGWLSHIAAGRRTDIFPLGPAEAALSSAVAQPELTADAIVALGAIGTPAVQERLAEVALSQGLSVESRQSAIVQLAFHIQRFGRMVANATAQSIADAFQQSADPQLHTAWAAVIGVLGPDRDAATPALLAFPPPAAPPAPAQ